MNPDHSAHHLGPRDRRTRGFSLIELAVVVAIISIVCAIAVPMAHTLIISARTDAVANDLRIFSGGFHTYAQEKGTWPPEADGSGVVPTGMEPYLRETNWTQPSPIGGKYTWDRNTLHQGHYYAAAISIRSVDGSPVTEDRNQLLEIDRKIDDGDLNTGRFLLGFHNYPVWVIEP